MKTIQIEIPEGKRAEWVNGVLTLVDEQPNAQPKFKVGNKAILTIEREFFQGTNVRKKVSKGTKVTISESYNDHSLYMVTHEDMTAIVTPNMLTPCIPQDITERIKTFEDAKDWCDENGHHSLVEDWCITTPYYEVNARDISAYLKLRIITCALNEGWEPKFDGEEKRCYGWYFAEDGSFIYKKTSSYRIGTSTDSSSKLVFKSEALAEYAAIQFKDIYMDFCYKGKE